MDGFYLVLWLFFLYSFAGWFLETGFSILLKKRMINRGVLNGPLCTIYGVTALIISIGFSELRNQWFFLFLGCATISTLVEWCAGHFLEKINHKKWWDYSNRKYNVDGYISLDFSILWGILGLLCLKFVNPLLVRIYQWLPSSFVHITLLALTILLLIDILGTYAVAFPALRKIRTIDDVSGNLHHLSQRLSTGSENESAAVLRKPILILPKTFLIQPEILHQDAVFIRSSCSFLSVLFSEISSKRFFVG